MGIVSAQEAQQSEVRRGNRAGRGSSLMPLAAAAGTPMPGMVLSPHTKSPGTGVLGPGQPAPSRAEIAGP
jgi:hypothetical protein